MGRSRSGGRKRSSNRKSSAFPEAVAFMADGEDAPAEAAGVVDDAPAEDAPADDAGDGGDDGGDDAGDMPANTGADVDDDGGNDIDSAKAAKYAARYADKAGIKSRIKLYKLCNMFEAGAAEMLVYALNNPMEKESALGRRTELLQSLYYLRHVSDIDDDFDQLEFEAEMKSIKIFRSKMGRLAAKENEYQDSDAEDSSDDELDDADDMDVLKEARKLMEFAFGKDEKAWRSAQVDGVRLRERHERVVVKKTTCSNYYNIYNYNVYKKNNHGRYECMLNKNWF